MSMILCLHRLPESEAAGYRADPASLDLDAIDQIGSDCFVDLDKSWHAIHHLLTDTAREEDHSAFALLRGGETLGDGPGRLLAPSEVTTFADLLTNTTEADLRARYDASRMQQLDLYPQIWDEPDDEVLEYVTDYFDLLRNFANQAAAAGQAVLIWMG